MRRRIFKRRVVALTAMLAIVLVPVALAYWSGIGSGSASGNVDDPQPIALGPGTPSAELRPGTSASVAVVLRNPNPYSVHVGALELDTSEGSGFGVDAAHSDCDVSTLSFTTQTNGGAGWMILPRVGSTDGTHTIDATNALAMGEDASSACQGASFTVNLHASG